jgi:hypothetical protein
MAPHMSVYDKLPTGLKAAIFIGILAIGPLMLLAFWLAGTRGGVVGILTIFVYFSVIYIVGVRRYIGDE